MSVYRLSSKLIFPNPELANKDGLLAVGGDLSIERIILAYKSGIFPWYNFEDPILWWSPNPRCVLFPKKIKISKSMNSLLKKNTFKVTYNQDFNFVINSCATSPRKGIVGSWLTNEMIEAYKRLHEKGVCHSVEVWYEKNIVGGLYGLSIGKIFFGESMFSLHANASKIAFIYLAKRLELENFSIIDCQVESEHLLSLGAEMIPRKSFLEILEQNNNSF